MGMDLAPSLFQNSFSELWNPAMVVVLAGIAVLYFLMIGRFRRRFPKAEPVSAAKQICFLTGLLLFYAAEGSPWGMLGDYLFSAHMISQAMAYFYVPPLIYFGLPRWFWKPILKKAVLKKIIAFLTWPGIALVLFNVLFGFYHMPFIFNFVMSDPVFMAIGKYLLLFTAFLMWWPIVTPLPELNQLDEMRKIAYVIASSLLITPACVLITFSSHLLYEPYMNVPQLLSFYRPLWDQQGAGALMYFFMELCYLIVIWVIALKWLNRVRTEKNDPYSVSVRSQAMAGGQGKTD